MYELGGYSNSSYTNYVFDAPINANGSVGTWSATANIPDLTYKGTTVVYGNYVYELGGYNGSVYLNNVSYTSFKTSKTIGVNVTPVTIYTNGSNSGNPGTGGYSGQGGIEIAYSGANTQCTSPGAVANVNVAPSELGTPYKLAISSDGCGNSTQLAQSVWVHYRLDDSQTASFPDVNANHTTISGFVISYDPNNAQRLRGGATFNNQTLQSLDAPPTARQ